MSDLSRVHAAAGTYRAIARRLLGTLTDPAPDDDAVLDDVPDGDEVAYTSDVLTAIADGRWDARLTDGQRATEAADRIDAGTEALKALRRDLDRIAPTTDTDDPAASDPAHDPAIRAITDAAAARLPVNRKERFYTGTVLPMLAFSDDFAHTHRLLTLCGLPGIRVDGDDGVHDVQTYTEYSFAESVFTPDDRRRFVDKPPAADTPDLVLTGPGWLLAIEAKMFDAVSAADLRRQLDAQAVLVDYWRTTLAVEHVEHVALLPRTLASRIGGELPTPVVLWEDVADAYRWVGPRFWVATLDQALRAGLHTDETLAFGINAHAALTGAELVAAAHSTDPPVYTVMGRNGGLAGKLLAADVATGGWRTQLYEVRRDGEPNRNWFPIAAFLDLVDRD